MLIETNDYMTIKDIVGSKYNTAKTNATTISTLCKKGLIESIRLGNEWLVKTSSLQMYQRRKRGVKLGQKIHRRS